MMGRVEGAGVSDRRFRAVFAEAARRHGFGRQLRIDQVDISNPLHAARAAGYVAKYNTKSADALPDVRRLNSDTGEIRHGGMRSWSASRSWGDTMRAMHLRRCQWAMAAEALRGAAANVSDAVGGALDPYQDHSATVGYVDSVSVAAQLL